MGVTFKQTAKGEVAIMPRAEYERLAEQARDDRGANAFRERDEVVDRALRALADEHHRPLRLGEHRGGPLELGRVGEDPR